MKRVRPVKFNCRVDRERGEIQDQRIINMHKIQFFVFGGLADY